MRKIWCRLVHREWWIWARDEFGGKREARCWNCGERHQ